MLMACKNTLMDVKRVLDEATMLDLYKKSNKSVVYKSPRIFEEKELC